MGSIWVNDLVPFETVQDFPKILWSFHMWFLLSCSIYTKHSSFLGIDCHTDQIHRDQTHAQTHTQRVYATENHWDEKNIDTGTNIWTSQLQSGGFHFEQQKGGAEDACRINQRILMWPGSLLNNSKIKTETLLFLSFVQHQNILGNSG